MTPVVRRRIHSMFRLLRKQMEQPPKDDGTRAAKRSIEFFQYLHSLPLWQYLAYHLMLRAKERIRRRLARRYLCGTGIEIGAQFNPLPIDPNSANVYYIDRIKPDVNAHLHNLDSGKFVPVDLLADAEALPMIKDRSLDFVIASHLLEHIPDPIAAVAEWIRIVKDGGTLFLAVPNRRCNEYDFQRSPADPDHIIKDFEVQDRDKKEEHWHEFVRVVEGISPDDPRFEPFLHEHYRLKDFRIHMHVFDEDVLDGIISYVKKHLYVGLQVVKNFRPRFAFEIIAILRKQELH